MQMYFFLHNGTVKAVELPSSDYEVVDGVPFGFPHVPFTPAYWLAQAHEHAIAGKELSNYPHRPDLASTAVYCLLGGHGITAEMATAAHAECLRVNLIDERCTRASTWQRALERPLIVGGRQIHYRFPHQKAIYSAKLMHRLTSSCPPIHCGIELRNWFLDSPGVGYKTAGWIVRNFMNESEVAIIDIHLYRAMILCGVFPIGVSLARHYLSMEKRFLNFCRALGVHASDFDLVIWKQMREFGRIAVKEFHSTIHSQPKHLALSVDS